MVLSDVPAEHVSNELKTLLHSRSTWLILSLVTFDCFLNLYNKKNFLLWRSVET